MNRTPRGNAKPPPPPATSSNSESDSSSASGSRQTRRAPSLKAAAEQNPSRLGDPVSLKAETSGPENPSTQSEGEGARDSNKKKGRSLKEAAMRNPTALGDPVSLKAEGSDTEPTEHDRGALRDGEDEKRERRRGSKL